jgi:hypothetical protein
MLCAQRLRIFSPVQSCAKRIIPTAQNIVTNLWRRFLF